MMTGAAGAAVPAGMRVGQRRKDGRNGQSDSGEGRDGRSARRGKSGKVAGMILVTQEARELF